jgi:hypothetical protein
MTCKTCNGEGITTTYENQAPIGSGLIWDEQIIDDCPDCTGNGICPGCDKEWSDETFNDYVESIGYLRSDDFACPYCDWKLG